MVKKHFKRICLVILLTISMSALLSACSNKKTQSKSDLSGKIIISGSTAVKPLVEESKQQFNLKYPKIIIDIKDEDSDIRINEVLDNEIQIVNSDVKVKCNIGDNDKLEKLVDYKVCGIGFAIISNKDVKVDSLTKKEIQDIFKGRITNWKQVGGEDLRIKVISRPTSSGSRTIFEETVMDGEKQRYGLGSIEDSSTEVSKKVSLIPGAISYIALPYLKDINIHLKPIKIDNIEASNENIISKKYHFWCYEHMYILNDMEKEKAFIEYMMSDENKDLLEKMGYIPMEYFN